MKYELGKYLSQIFTTVIISLICIQLCQAENYSGKVGYLVKCAENYTKQRNHGMALAMYSQAIRIQPGDLELYYRRAASYGRAGYYQNAIKDLTLVINSDEISGKMRYTSARKFRAECYSALGYYEKAIADYRYMLNAKESSAKIAKIYYYLAELYAFIQRNDLAITTINSGLKIKSSWSVKLNELHKKIMTGQIIKLHLPFTN
jgi:tetratricopeptide (TPR) repeat protein